MNVTPALAYPGPFEFVVLLGLAAIVVLAIVGAKMRLKRLPPAFPMITNAEKDGPGTYRVCGVDKNTHDDRQLDIKADSRANAVVKAELDGVIVTSVSKSV